MKQLHVVSTISSSAGGEGFAALRYAHALALAGDEVTLFVAEKTSDEFEPPDRPSGFRIVWGSDQRPGNAIRRILGQVRALVRCLDAGGYSLLHIHGTWSPLLAIACFYARRRSLLVVASPHGCVEPWALNHKRIKKAIALAIYQRRVFAAAAMLVATAEQELASIRRLGFSNPVAVVPLGVDLVPGAEDCRSDQFRRILFLSRIHPKKGLPDLIDAWATVRRPGWKVVIAGPSEDGYEEAIKSLVRARGIEDDFEFPGMVRGTRKEQLFAQADVFVLPTFSENFGLVIAEALARGLPVITTTGTPWRELREWGCGWWVASGAPSVTAALADALSLPREQLREMGARGRSLILHKYTWRRIGEQALQASRWVAGDRARRPDFVAEGK